MCDWTGDNDGKAAPAPCAAGKGRHALTQPVQHSRDRDPRAASSQWQTRAGVVDLNPIFISPGGCNPLIHSLHLWPHLHAPPDNIKRVRDSLPAGALTQKLLPNTGG